MIAGYIKTFELKPISDSFGKIAAMVLFIPFSFDNKKVIMLNV